MIGLGFASSDQAAIIPTCRDSHGWFGLCVYAYALMALAAFAAMVVAGMAVYRLCERFCGLAAAHVRREGVNELPL